MCNQAVFTELWYLPKSHVQNQNQLNSPYMELTLSLCLCAPNTQFFFLLITFLHMLCPHARRHFSLGITFFVSLVQLGSKGSWREHVCCSSACFLFIGIHVTFIQNRSTQQQTKKTESVETPEKQLNLAENPTDHGNSGEER